MRTLVHLSDLHFSAVDPALVPVLAETVQKIQPDILAVSGDLTQHATPDEFRAAMEFIGSLPGTPVVVPGNHDMSFYNPLRRATQRLHLFRELVTNDSVPYIRDGEISVLGLNTARVSHLRNGRIRSWQVRLIEERMGEAASGAVRVVVTHHPFDLPAVFPADELIGSGRVHMARLVRCVDLMLAGHMHISHAGPTALRFNTSGESAVFVQAGTALSTRVRTEPNSFQVIRTAPGAIEVEPYVEASGRYHPSTRQLFRQVNGAWTAGHVLS